MAFRLTIERPLFQTLCKYHRMNSTNAVETRLRTRSMRNTPTRYFLHISCPFSLTHARSSTKSDYAFACTTSSRHLMGLLDMEREMSMSTVDESEPRRDVCSFDAVEFRMIVFRPFKGEIIGAVVKGSSPAGVQGLLIRTDRWAFLKKVQFLRSSSKTFSCPAPCSSKTVNSKSQHTS